MTDVAVWQTAARWRAAVVARADWLLLSQRGRKSRAVPDGRHTALNFPPGQRRAKSYSVGTCSAVQILHTANQAMRAVLEFPRSIDKVFLLGMPDACETTMVGWRRDDDRGSAHRHDRGLQAG